MPAARKKGKSGKRKRNIGERGWRRDRRKINGEKDRGLECRLMRSHTMQPHANRIRNRAPSMNEKSKRRKSEAAAVRALVHIYSNFYITRDRLLNNRSPPVDIRRRSTLVAPCSLQEKNKREIRKEMRRKRECVSRCRVRIAITEIRRLILPNFDDFEVPFRR